ncbi:unnamed protein product [Echinostoma caproni]|uniref:Uncharacterized protein n=1 Tax=Echinostoma caproni TaxID=27848 RepID=A0A183A095_9TREM|nr:unnamed protein product [Echinostoma caproni]
MNVLNWLHTLNLAHLRQSITSSTHLDMAPGPLEVNAGVALDQDNRPCATTPTPESVLAYTNGSGENDRFESNGAIRTRESPQPDSTREGMHYLQQSDCTHLTNGIGRLDLAEYLRRESIASRRHTLTRSPAPYVPVHNGSSDAVDDESPYINLSRDKLSSTSLSHRFLTPSNTTLPKSVTPVHSKQQYTPDTRTGCPFTSVFSFNMSSTPSRPNSLPRRILELPKPSPGSDQWIASCSSSVSSRTTQQDRLQLPLPASRSTGQSNGNGILVLSNSTNKLEQTEKQVTNSASGKPPGGRRKPVQDKTNTNSSNPQPIRHPVPQVRSSSVGSRLRRSHARRWNSKPDVCSTREPIIKPHSDEPPTNRDFFRLCDPAAHGAYRSTTKSSTMSANLAPQNYHHHYYYYYYQQLGMIPAVNSGPPRAMTPPLTSRDPPTRLNEFPCGNTNPKPPISTCKNGLTPALSGRLAHRLYTHPLPRQNGCMHRALRFDPCTVPPTIIQPTNPPRSVVEHRPPLVTRNGPPGRWNSDFKSAYPRDPLNNNLGRSPSRGPHRSSSQPANSHDWLSFETEL